MPTYDYVYLRVNNDDTYQAAFGGDACALTPWADPCDDAVKAAESLGVNPYHDFVGGDGTLNGKWSWEPLGYANKRFRCELLAPKVIP